MTLTVLNVLRYGCAFKLQYNYNLFQLRYGCAFKRNIYYIIVKRKGKAILGQALRVPRGWGSQILRQSTHEGGKVVRLTHRPPLQPRRYSWCSFRLKPESTQGPLSAGSIMTPSGNEPATFRLVAQCLNQLHDRRLAFRYLNPLKPELFSICY